jgi:hypothetical protein
MMKTLRLAPCKFTIVVAAIAFISPGTVPLAQAKGRLLNEDAALSMLLRTLERDHVYDKRVSLNCVTFGNEETTREYFQFVLRENHTEKCGGDPEVSPVVDRYRVHRASEKIELWNAVGDAWKPYPHATAAAH